MEMHQLRYFVAVAREGNFTRAARACHVAQPSLSQQIRKLEEELGQSLLHRLKSGKSVLTPAGELFFPRAVRILQEANTAAAELEHIGEHVSGSVRMGAIPTLAPYLVPDSVLRFNRDYPDVELIVHETTTAELLAMLWRNELDFALASPPFSGGPWEMQRLGAEALLLAAPAVAVSAGSAVSATVAEASGAPAVPASVQSARAKGGRRAKSVVSATAAVSAAPARATVAAVSAVSASATSAVTSDASASATVAAASVANATSATSSAPAGKKRAARGSHSGFADAVASGSVMLSDLASEEFILMREGHCLSNQVLGFCQQADFKPKVRFLSAQVETLKALIRAGAGISLLPSLAIDAADTSLRYIRLDDTPAPQREIVALWRPEFPLSRAATEFIRALKQTLESKIGQGL